MATATQQTQITDPALIFFHTQKETVFQQTKKQFETSYISWAKVFKDLQAFEVEVKNRASDLQNKRVVTPEKGDLQQEKIKYQEKFWGYFKPEVKNIDVFVSGLSSTIKFLTPEPRVYTDEEPLDAQSKRSDETFKDHAAKLTEALTRASGLKGRFVTLLDGDVAWFTQKFCQIVDNGGEPISTWTRIVDQLTTPVVPKLSSKAAEEPKMTEAGQKPASSEVAPSASKEAVKALDEKKETKITLPAVSTEAEQKTSSSEVTASASKEAPKASEEKKETEKTSPAAEPPLAVGAGRGAATRQKSAGKSVSA